MKLSEITNDGISQDVFDAVIDYLRLDSDIIHHDNIIPLIILAAKLYIASATGLNDTEIDEYNDLNIAFLCLCAEMYDSRTYTVTNDKVNPLVRSILKMHDKYTAYCPDESEDDEA